MPRRVPLCLRSDAESDCGSLEVERVRSGWDSDGAGLRLPSRFPDEEEDGRTADDASLSFLC